MIDWSNCLPYKSFQKQPFCKIYTILMLNWCHKRYWFYNIFKKFTVLTIILLDLCSLYYVTLKPICSKFSIQSSVFFYSQLFYFRKDNRNVYFSFHRLENQGCHTVHMHMPVWLKSLKKVSMDRIRGSISSDDS